VLDEVVATLYEGPNSYTGEDLVEIACHGNPKIVEEILSQIVSRETRLAEPGEFTRRALANNKLSVDQVEALDLILNATTLAGVDIGLRAKTLGLGRSVDEISSSLLDLQVRVESQLDFSEAEVGAYDAKQILSSFDQTIDRLESWAKHYDSNRHFFQRWVVALVGKPNSGKSSLFNALIGANKAIVFDEPGTTRDYLTHDIELNGVPISLIDTAGIRNNPENIEALGIAKTREIMSKAEVICWVDEEGLPPPAALKNDFIAKKWILIGSKSDLGPRPTSALSVSSKSGQGLSELRAQISPKSADSILGDDDWPPLTSVRQYKEVVSGVQHLQKARELLVSGGFLDQAAQEVRMACKNIQALVPVSPPSNLIHSVFERFCIGK
jgi:tRNA modification GTPase